MTRPHHEPSSGKYAYASDDLKRFGALTDEVMSDLRKADNYPLEPGLYDILRPRVGAAIFKYADGEQARSCCPQAAGVG